MNYVQTTHSKNIRFHQTLNTSQHEQQVCAYLSLLLTQALFKHILALSPNSYTYLRVTVLCFAGPPSYPLNKGAFRS